MYICQDKCYRLVSEEDHHFAQREDYVFGARFCAICCVIIRRGSEAYNQMLLKRWSNGGLWQCPCCEARPRQYFDLQQKQEEYWIQKFRKSQLFREIVEHFFRESIGTEEDKNKQILQSIKHVLSDPKYAEPDKTGLEHKMTMYTILDSKSTNVHKAVEISMFPQQ